MDIDTGASVSMISEKWTRIKGLVPQLTLNTNKAPLLRTYTGRTIQPLGQVRLGLDRNNQHHKLNAPGVPGSEPNLLERDWLSVLKLNFAAVHQVDRDDVLEPYQAEVFRIYHFAKNFLPIWQVVVFTSDVLVEVHWIQIQSQVALGLPHYH